MSQDKKVRQPGYYHVRTGRTWMVAQWLDGRWLLPGRAVDFYDYLLDEIDERRIDQGQVEHLELNVASLLQEKMTLIDNAEKLANQITQRGERIKELEAYIQKLLNDGDNEARIADFHQRLP